jgi:hypothetical protein
MKRPSPATLMFAVLALICAAFALQAKSSDSDATPAAAAAPVERVVAAEPAVASAPTAQAAAQPVATAQPTATAKRTAKARTRTHRRPAARFALPSNRALAVQECRDEAFDDAAEFRFTFGQGKAATRRCARAELAKQRADCRAEAIEDPFDYRAEYGSGRQGLTRCVRDALT